MRRGETRHSSKLDDKQLSLFSFSVAFCHIAVVSQGQDGSCAVAGYMPTHTHSKREWGRESEREWSSIRELECLVERLLFIGSLWLNREQRWANNKDETLGERVASHSTLAGIGMWFCCGLLIRSFTPINHYGITMVVENKTETKRLSQINYILFGIINDRDSLSIK